ncbi:hypothetical protein AL532_07405 [Pseudomonas monteilii]|nr:hypothetical protein AL532_07405 [Pseudomonas monteilii]
MTNGTKKLMFSFRTFNRTTTISYKCLMKFQNISPKNPYFTLTFLDMKGQSVLINYAKPLLHMQCIAANLIKWIQHKYTKDHVGYQQHDTYKRG